MIWPVQLMLVIGPAGLGALALLWIARLTFRHRVGQMRAALEASQLRSAPAPEPLPEIMRSYAVRAGGRRNGPALFHARHRALLIPAVDKPPMRIKAEQCTGTIPPGLVWQATGTMNGLPVSVVDAYVDGAGLLEVRALDTVLVSGGSGPDYDKGELLRYLSELPVYPDAILNACGLTWRQLDPRTVEVAARSRSGVARLRFIFDANGDIAAMEADDRPMTVGDGTVPTRWVGSYSDYRQFGSYRLPFHGEVAWQLSDGLHTYWKGDLVSYAPLPLAGAGI